MKVIKAFFLAFSLYSKIPTPRVYWNRDNMRYAICFLPLVGAAVGGILMAWFHICMLIRVGNACFAAVAAALPALITGGIHTDGFIDTCDALFSYGSKQKKLEIMHDPHVGAFGVISAVIYYMLYFGFLNEITIYGEAAMIALGFVMSRSLCAVTIALMRTARNNGMIYEMSSSINKAVTLVVTITFMIACALVMIFLSPYIGGAALFFLIAMVFYYKFFVVKKTGGITGDTCGWFIQMCEITTLIVVVIGGKLV